MYRTNDRLLLSIFLGILRMYRLFRLWVVLLGPLEKIPTIYIDIHEIYNIMYQLVFIYKCKSFFKEDSDRKKKLSNSLSFVFITQGRSLDSLAHRYLLKYTLRIFFARILVLQPVAVTDNKQGDSLLESPQTYYLHK